MDFSILDRIEEEVGGKIVKISHSLFYSRVTWYLAYYLRDGTACKAVGFLIWLLFLLRKSGEY